ncbi:MAG: hypothetical protein E7189_06580 [Erysipelotrichaceae bacterium]|nr:hypothetical protein [Erysipelotrichaceae bacterium]
MKVVFNDLSEMTIQDFRFVEGRLNIKTLTEPEELRKTFSEVTKTRKMKIVYDDESELEIDGYTEMYSLEKYTGKIYGINMYKPAETPEAKEEALADVVKLAKLQAKKLDDVTALELPNLFDEWDSTKHYIVGDRCTFNGVLYKCIQSHDAQPNLNPLDAHSLWAKVLGGQDGTIGEWEQPNASNTYSKGDRVTHNGKTWESMVDKNGWEPGGAGVYETIWKEIK